MNNQLRKKQMKNFQRNAGMGTIAPGILPGVKPEDLGMVSCKCGVKNFIPVSELRSASRFQTSVGQPMLVNFQGGYACMGCGKVNDFNTDESAPNKDEQVENKPEDNGGNVIN